MAKSADSFKNISACVSNRTYGEGYNFKKQTHRGIDEAIIAKDVVRAYLADEYDYSSRQTLQQDIRDSYTVVDNTEKTQEIYERNLAGQLDRLLKSLKSRRDAAVIPEEDIHVSISHIIDDEYDFPDKDDISVSFTAIFDEVDGNGTPQIEGIVVKTGLPKIGANKRSCNNINNEIPLYLRILALRQYAEANFEEGEEVSLVASYYYLKKAKDTSKSLYEDPYFGKDEPIRALQETYIVGGDTTTYISSLDIQFKPLIQKWIIGKTKDDLNEEKDCKKCLRYPICYYTPVPELQEDKKAVVKKRAKIELNSEQQAIVNAREGWNLCIAPPGSGKTEVIKERIVSMVTSELADLEEKYKAGEDVSFETTDFVDFTKSSEK